MEVQLSEWTDAEDVLRLSLRRQVAYKERNGQWIWCQYLELRREDLPTLMDALRRTFGELP